MAELGFIKAKKSAVQQTRAIYDPVLTVVGYVYNKAYLRMLGYKCRWRVIRIGLSHYFHCSE